MRTIRSFKAIRAVTCASLLTAAIIIIAVCAFPRAMMTSLHSEIMPRLHSAIEKAHTVETSDALDDIIFIKDRLSDNMSALMTLFPHEHIYGLFRAVRSAEELAPENESAQLLAELTSIESELTRLSDVNRASLSNLF